MRTGQVVGRLAPSPTGDLHLGHARTGLVAWLAARAQGGRLILRMEDLDPPRNLPGAAERILADLAWLGLDWDEGPDVGGANAPYLQSARQARYAEALVRLHDQGLLYGCRCSRADLARLASAPHAGEEGPPYPGFCRGQSSEADFGVAYDPRVRRPAWRFRVPEGRWAFDDAILGHQEQDLQAEVGDFVLRRADGVMAYQLAVVVDDLAMGVNQVVRGADLVASTPRQLALWRALGGLALPSYAHVPLVLNQAGQRLAKRDGATAVAALRAQGLGAEALVGALAFSLGLRPDASPLRPGDLLPGFSLGRIHQEAWRAPEAWAALGAGERG